MKKRILMLFGALVLLFLAACGGNQESSGESEGDSGGSDGDQITLRMAWWGDQVRNEYTNEVIALYEEQNPNITVEAEYASWDDYWRKLSPQAAANQLPDIIQMDLKYLTQYAQSNQLADLSPYLEEQIDVSNISENSINVGRINDGIYGFNAGVNAVSFQYNPALLEEIGVDPAELEDWTWEDYQSFSDQAAEAGVYFDTSMRADSFLEYYLRTNGESLYSEDGSGLGYEDDQLAADFFRMSQEQVESGGTPPPDVLAQVTGLEDSPVVKDESAGVFQWSNQFVGTQEATDSELEITAPPGPGVSDGLFLKPSMFWSVAESSEHKEAAADFIDFYTNSPEANKIILGERGVPVSSEIKEVIKEDITEAQAKVIEYIEWVEENSSPMAPADPAAAGEVIELMMSLQEEVSYGQITPEEAAERFRSQAESLLQ